jgi:uracil-DNA glycosylase
MQVLTEFSKNIDSYVDFWKLAGVDFSLADTSVDWFELSKAPKNAPQPDISSNQNQKPRLNDNASVKSLSENQHIVDFVAADQWPTSFAELHSQIEAGIAFPGNTFGRHIAIPNGQHNPDVLIVGDVPEIDEIEAKSMAAGRSSSLAIQMSAITGIYRDKLYITALATTRPGSGALPPEIHNDLKAFFHHICSVVRPKRILILGPAACEILLGVDFMKARGNLHYINHDVGNVAAVTTFHPRTLMSNPALKSAAWQDLQILVKKEA